ncbi:hypothetical protein T484DRAFT_1928255, partial [Baffinella frigidus]
TKRRGDEVVYNLAVLEVDRILQQGKLSEEALVELQRNFAKGAMMAVPGQTRVGQAAQGGAPDPAGMEQNSRVRTAAAADGPPQARQMEVPYVDNSDAMSVAASTATAWGAAKAVRKSTVDEWSIITLYNDVSHLEEETKKKEKLLAGRSDIRKHLAVQVDARERQKREARQAEVELAKDQVKAYDKWKNDQDVALQKKLDKRLVEREVVQQEQSRVQIRRKQAAEVELKEAKVMIDGFQKEMDSEKAKKEVETLAKHKAYQSMLVENKKNLDLKTHVKLFQMQIDRAEAEDRQRQVLEERRQEKLKKAERMAGDLNNRAAEMEAQLEERVRKAQEENKRRDEERDKKKIQDKISRDQEMASVLSEQVKLKYGERQRVLEDNKRVAETYRRDADEYLRVQEKAKQDRLSGKQNFQEMLNQQIATKHSKHKAEGGMSATELRMNAHLLKKVLVRAPDLKQGVDIPGGLMDRIEHTQEDRTQRA